MTWNRVRDLVDEVLQLPAEKRASYLDEECRQPELRSYIDSLILPYEQAHDFLEQPAWPSCAPIWEETTNELIWIGRRIGQYQIEEKIGEGGMGAVFRATRADDEYQKQVAIKLIKQGFETRYSLARFRAERQILANLVHPNIAGLLDGGQTEDGFPYLVMELIEGQPIDQYCASRKLSIEGRLKLFCIVCTAVQYAHQNLVIHRDLKPANILVTAGGEPKLLDFGIAKLLSTDPLSRESEHTISTMRILTPEYASPEQVRGSIVTTATDVYSLGVVLYVLLTGHHPYQLKYSSAATLTEIICGTEPLKPSSLVGRTANGGTRGRQQGGLTFQFVSSTQEGKSARLSRKLSGDLDNILLMALRKDPQRRYASAGQFSRDINLHLQGLPILAHQDTFTYRSNKFIKRHRLALGAIALLFFTLLGGILTTLRQARIARAERASAERRFNDVRHLANSLMFEVHDSIKDLPGATPARQLLVVRALEYLDVLSREAKGDTSLQRELATAYEKVGDVQGNPFYSNLGDMPGALQSYRKGLDILSAISAAEPNNADINRSLSSVYYKLATCLDASGNYQEALNNSRKALAIDEKLSINNDPADKDNLAGDYNDIGLKLGRIGDLPAALANYRRAQNIREAIKTTSLKQENAVRLHLASDLSGEADTLLLSGSLSEALETQRRAVAILEELSKKNPDNETLSTSLGQAYEAFGSMLTKGGNSGPALQNDRQAIEIFKKISTADPLNELAKRSLGFTEESLAKVLINRNDAEGALEYLHEAQTIFKSFPTNETKNDFVLSGTAETYSAMGLAHVALAQRAKSATSQREEHWREARTWFRRSLDIWLDMRGRGALAKVDEEKPQEMMQQLATCDAALRRLLGSRSKAI